MKSALKIAPSGKKFFAMPVQSPALCVLQDEYGYLGYRSDYRDITTYMAGMDGYIFEEDEVRAEAFFHRAEPLITAAIREVTEQEQEAEAEAEAYVAKIDNELTEWDRKFPHGRRIYFSTWGKGAFKTPAFAIQKSVLDAPSDVVAAAICRKNSMIQGSRVCSQGTSLTNNRPDSHHYSVVIGTPCRGGGVSGRYQVWFSIPC